MDIKETREKIIDWAISKGFFYVPSPEHLAEVAALQEAKTINATKARFLLRYIGVQAYFENLSIDKKEELFALFS